MRFGCCLGLATFLTPTTPREFLLKTLSHKQKLEILPSMMAALERNGFDFAEAEVSLLLPEGVPEDFKAFEEKMRPFSIKPEVFSAFIPPDLKVVGPHVDKVRLKRYLEQSISKTAEAGGKVIIWGSGSSRTYPANFSREEAYMQIEEFLNCAADFARENRIYMAIEHMTRNDTNTINSLKEAFALANKISRKEIKLMLDFDHFMTEKEEIGILEEIGRDIVHVHISDRQRKCPGDGDYPFHSLFNMLKRIGYQESISLECNFQDFERESKRGLDYIKSSWEEKS
jgi:sugar phosphate isomerase/epimerase